MNGLKKPDNCHGKPEKHFMWHLFPTIHVLNAQQKYKYENDVHQVTNRIVSIRQPYVHPNPIVRGKVSKQTEFGTKLHPSVVERGIAKIEHLSFDAYDEGMLLQNTLEAYKYQNCKCQAKFDPRPHPPRGQIHLTTHNQNHCYPKRVLVDQIYRTQDNIGFAKRMKYGLAGRSLGGHFLMKKQTVDCQREE